MHEWNSLPTATAYCYVFSVLCSFAVFARKCSHECTNMIPCPLPRPTATSFCVICSFAVFARENRHECTNGIPCPLPLPTATSFSVLCSFAVFARENSHECTNVIPCPLPLPTATSLAFFAPLQSLRETSFPTSFASLPSLRAKYSQINPK